MGSMLIRNIPDEVLKRFKARAKAEGKSAEQLGREVIGEKGRMTREEAWAEIDAIRARSKPVSGSELVEEIRHDREHGFGSSDLDFRR